MGAMDQMKIGSLPVGSINLSPLSVGISRGWLNLEREVFSPYLW
jgi:hypothetical protein